MPWHCSRWGLPSRPSPLGRWCALTAPFHPYLDTSKNDEPRRFLFCGNNPAGCPGLPLATTVTHVESGLSSTRGAHLNWCCPAGRNRPGVCSRVGYFTPLVSQTAPHAAKQTQQATSPPAQPEQPRSLLVGGHITAHAPPPGPRKTAQQPMLPGSSASRAAWVASPVSHTVHPPPHGHLWAAGSPPSSAEVIYSWAASREGTSPITRTDVGPSA